MRKNSLVDYATSGHMLIIYTLAIFWVAYQAAYKFINPANLQWQQALVQAALAVLSAIVYGHLTATRTTGLAIAFKAYALNWHALALYVLAILWVGYQAAYQYLDPQHLQWQQALIQAVLAVLSAIVYGHLVLVPPTTTIDGANTMNMPSVRRASLSDPRNPQQS